MRFVTKRVDLGRDVDIDTVAAVAFHPDTIRAFHGSTSRISDWTTPDFAFPHVQSRTVRFQMPFPALLKGLLPQSGSEVIAVQTRHWDSTGRVRVNSHTSLGVHPVFTVKHDGNHHIIFEADVQIRADFVPRPLRGIAERLASTVAARELGNYVGLVEAAVKAKKF